MYSRTNIQLKIDTVYSVFCTFSELVLGPHFIISRRLIYFLSRGGKQEIILLFLASQDRIYEYISVLHFGIVFILV